jgi:hypothetical protein
MTPGDLNPEEQIQRDQIIANLTQSKQDGGKGRLS